MHPLDGAFARINWAGEHLADLESSIKLAIEQEQKRLASQFDSQSGQGRVRTFSTIQYVVPLRWAIIIGEILYNLRSALDYLIYELTIIDSGVEKNGTQFPIESTKDGFGGRGNTYLKGLSVKHKADIEALQPYNGHDWIGRFATLSNQDKHRLLTPVVNITQSVVEKGHVGQFEGLPGHVHRTKSPSGKSEMDVYADFTLYITFNDGTPVVQTLRQLIYEVRVILEAFKSEFK